MPVSPNSCPWFGNGQRRTNRLVTATRFEIERTRAKAAEARYRFRDDEGGNLSPSLAIVPWMHIFIFAASAISHEPPFPRVPRACLLIVAELPLAPKMIFSAGTQIRPSADPARRGQFSTLAKKSKAGGDETGGQEGCRGPGCAPDWPGHPWLNQNLRRRSPCDNRRQGYDLRGSSPSARARHFPRGPSPPL